MKIGMHVYKGDIQSGFTSPKCQRTGGAMGYVHLNNLTQAKRIPSKVHETWRDVDVSVPSSCVGPTRSDVPLCSRRVLGRGQCAVITCRPFPGTRFTFLQVCSRGRPCRRLGVSHNLQPPGPCPQVSGARGARPGDLRRDPRHCGGGELRLSASTQEALRLPREDCGQWRGVVSGARQHLTLDPVQFHAWACFTPWNSGRPSGGSGPRGLGLSVPVQLPAERHPHTWQRQQGRGRLFLPPSPRFATL